MRRPKVLDMLNEYLVILGEIESSRHCPAARIRM